MGGLAQQLLDPVGVADAGKLHDDARVALLGDLRVDHAGLVDAAADDLDGLLDGAAGAGVERDRRQRQDDGAVRGGGHVEFGRVGGALGGDQRADRRLRRVQLGGVPQFQQDAVLVGLRLQRLVEDRAGAESLTDAVHHAVQALLDHRLHVHLEQEVGAAAQVEAEMHLPPRQPGAGAGNRFGMQRIAPSRQRPRMTAVFRGVKYIMGGGCGFPVKVAP